jgi:SAM-dependent methyltransferase
VYIGEQDVYRMIHDNEAGRVLEIFYQLEKGIDGVIRAEICRNDCFPHELMSEKKLILKHPKVEFISYPNEWCALMLKDSAIFHLELCERILNEGLYLKDAHPWNILFDCGRPVFVDFTSIVNRQGLFEEEYLFANHSFVNASDNNRLVSIVYEIFSRMYQPYFSRPLMLYAFGQRERVRGRIQDTTLNASTSIISFYECFPKLRKVRSAINKIWLLYKAYRYEKLAFKTLKKTEELKCFFGGLRKQVEALKVEIGGSAYSLYYQKKGEDQNKEFSDSWNSKQKNVYQALKSHEIVTVLDVACNTGWYALMAEKMGKTVVAFDIDEGCIESLYTQVRDGRLNILPLVMNFTKLTPDRYSIYDGKKVLINAHDRLRSDSVIALGIIHHLILGLGMTFASVLDSLTLLCKKQIIIEFVEKDDAMIQGEPEFFPAYFKNRSILSNYNLEDLVFCIEEHGFDVDVQASYPDTRKILVCSKKVLS